MAPRKLSTSSADRGRPLADFLATRLDISGAAAAALVRRGSVYLDRRREEDPQRPLADHHKIIVHDAQAPGSPAPAPPVIAYRDADVLVADKPAGVPTQATRQRSDQALDRAIASLDPSARLLHRLDRGASGLVLFTRTPAARRRFAGLLADNLLARRYRALVHGHLAADQGLYDHAIAPDPVERRRMTAGHGRPAVTRYRVLRRGAAPDGAPLTLLELDLETGRTHQIRVHLAHAGHPLVGDALYGGAAAPASAIQRLYLHAACLSWPGAAPVESAVPPAFAELIGWRGND